jgi:hypothetical protein
VLALLGTNKIENLFFMLQVKKNLVTKVVGLGKIHISARNGVKIQKFAMELALTMVKLGRKPSEVLLGAIFCEEFFS